MRGGERGGGIHQGWEVGNGGVEQRTGDGAACSALLPFTGLIPPGGAAAWALLALSVPLLVAGEMAVREE